MVGTQLRMSTAYHPQTDGQTEVVNRCLEAYLRCFSCNQPKQWSRWIGWAEFWYNTTYHSSIKTTPFCALYGRDPPSILRYVDEGSAVEEVNQLMDERNCILDELKTNLARAQNQMKQLADKKRRDIHYQVDDMVYLKLQPYKQKSLATRRYQKLSPRYYGPFTILEKIGEVAYRLELPPTSKIHNVFHVSQLKQSVGSPSTVQPLPKSLSDELELSVQPADILNFRTIAGGKMEVLVKWHDLPSFESTWELCEVIAEQFPDFHLEDKVNAMGGGIDGYGPRYARQFTRRTKPKVVQVQSDPESSPSPTGPNLQLLEKQQASKQQVAKGI